MAQGSEFRVSGVGLRVNVLCFESYGVWSMFYLFVFWFLFNGICFVFYGSFFWFMFYISWFVVYGKGLGCRVWGVLFGIQGLGFKSEGIG